MLPYSSRTVQHRPKYSTRWLSDDLLSALASLRPERAREAFAALNLSHVRHVAVCDEFDPEQQTQPVRDQARALDPPRATESHLSRFFFALSDKTRRNILRLLEVREYCVSEIVSHFELSQPTISRHLTVLRQANLVTRRRQGRQVLYSLSHDRLPQLANQFFGKFE